jgi:hypothetical protein
MYILISNSKVKRMTFEFSGKDEGIYAAFRY